MENPSESFPSEKKKKTDWSLVEKILKKQPKTETTDNPKIEITTEEAIAEINTSIESAREKTAKEIEKIKEKGKEVIAKARAGTLTEEEREAFKKLIK